MKNHITLFLLLSCIFVSAQDNLTLFSEASNMPIGNSKVVKLPKGFVINIKRYGIDPPPDIFIKLTELGEIQDSINMESDDEYIFGDIIANNDYFYNIGLLWDKGTFYTQRYFAREYSSDLELLREFQGPINLDHSKGVFRSYQTSDGHANRMYDYHIFNDTIFGYGDYLVVDSPNVIQARGNFYFKGNMNGQVYHEKTIPSVQLYNSFFLESNMYVQGSVTDPNDAGRPKSVGLYDHNGEWINGWDFDDAQSGAFPWGAVGGIIGDRLYFSYLGRDPTMDGCTEKNVAIDVRTPDFELIKRFKIDECGYLYAGNMPFAADSAGNIYFQAISESYKTLLVQKYSPELDLIWSNTYSFDEDEFFFIPRQIFALDDGSVLLHVNREVNGRERIELYKITQDSIVSSQELYREGEPEPMVLTPNPVINQAKYIGPHSQPLVAEIYSISGVVQQRTSFDGDILNMSDLPGDLYRVNIKDATTDELLHRQTVVKQ